MIQEDPVGDQPGRLLTLELPGLVVGAPIGRRIQVSGNLAGERLFMKGVWKVVDQATTTESNRNPGQVAESHAAEVETYKVVVILVNFSDLALPSSCSTSAVGDTFFDDLTDSVKAFYWEQSFHQFDIEGVVAGPYTLTTPSSSCSESFNTWSHQADNKARRDVADFNSYDSRFYIIPVIPTEPYCDDSWGYIGFGQAVVTSQHCTDPAGASHELGHNLGLDHANKLFSSGAECDGCDFSSTMGGVGGAGTLRHFNAPHKLHLGWIPSERVLSVTQTGLYTISLLEQDDPGLIQVLKLDLEGLVSPHYVSYRTGLGPYAENISTDYRPKMNIHRFAGGQQHTFFLGSDINNSLAFTDGQTWSDAGNTVCVTMESHTDTTATIWVALDCVDDSPACPTVTPCTDNCGVTGAETGFADTGQSSCEKSNGTHFGCAPASGETIHVISTTCGWSPCCTTFPACVCPQTCPGGTHLECRAIL